MSISKIAHENILWCYLGLVSGNLKQAACIINYVIVHNFIYLIANCK